MLNLRDRRSSLTLFRILSLLLVSSVVAAFSPSASAYTYTNSPAEAYQAAEILGIRVQVDRLLLLQNHGQDNASRDELLRLRVLVLRKILLGFLEVRRASNKSDVELSYAYDVMYREQHKEAAVLEALNLLNFAQLAVLYTIAPSSRIHKQFKQSNILGLVNAGLSTTLPITGILYSKYHKLSNIAPPKALTNVLDGKPVDASGLTELVTKFLEAPEPGGTKSRKELMFEFWQKNYQVNPDKKETLAGINDNKRISMGVLNTRVILLWSLRNHIQSFDHELMALSNLVKTPSAPSANASISPDRLSAGALEAAQLLKLEAPVAELIALNRSNTENERRLELEIFVLEKILAATLDIRIATDKVDRELNYSYDIVLSQLLDKRGAALQKNFEMNFIQNGASISVVKTLFLKGYPKTANELLTVTSGIGTALSILALAETHGGRKKIEGGANSLADFLGLEPSQYHFSALISEFLNTPSSESNDGKSRKDELNEIWKRDQVSTMSLKSRKNCQQLAALAPARYDTIKIVSNRVALLQSLKANLEFFDADLFELVKQTAFDSKQIRTDEPQNSSLNASAAQAAKLLSLESRAARLIEIKHGNAASQATGTDLLGEELSLTRKILEAMLEVRVTADKLDLEIVKETNMRDRMTRNRDLGIAITDNANFFQLGILSLIGTPVGLQSKPRYGYYSSMFNVVSGYLVGGLTAASFLQQRGGFRPRAAEPNMLAQILGLDAEPEVRFSPMVWSFLNSPNPIFTTDKTRKEQLLEYWKQSKVVCLNPGNHSAAEKLAAAGAQHKWWSESIKLINSRLNMLYAVRATVDRFDIGLTDLLLALD